MRIRELFRLQKIAGSKRFQVVSITVLLLVVSAGTYVTFYISGQTDYFNRSNFRQLNSLSSQISARVDDLKNGFRSSVQYTLKGGNRGNFEESLKSVEGTKFTSVEHTGNVKDLKDEEIERIPCSIDLLLENGTPSLQLRCFAGEQQFGGRAKLSELIAPFLNNGRHLRWEHEEGFDDLLIAKAPKKDDAADTAESGEVIFEQGTAELAIKSLNNLPLADTPDKKLDFASLSQTSNSVDVKLGGGSYKLYVEPLEMNTGSAGSHWIICGLVDSSHFRHQTWAVSYTVIIIVGFFASLVPISWPFLKILFIGPKDRLRIADGYFASFSLVIGTAVITLFISWLYAYSTHERELNNQLSDLSAAISRNYSDELGKTLNQIQRVNSIRKSSPQEQSTSSADGAKQDLPRVTEAKMAESNGAAGKPAPPADDQAVQMLQTKLCPLTIDASTGKPSAKALEAQTTCLTGPDAYPYFDIVFWTDSAGKQVTKWLLTSNRTNPHRVNERSYFTAITNGRALKLEGQDFWIAPQTSSVTGAKTVVISQPIDKEKPADGIVAMAGSLPAVMGAITPPGFGYRIIDNKGDVQLQSSETQQWKENFFEESNDDPQLRSIVQAHLKNFLDLNYQGRTHSILVTPLDHSPGWSLVVFRDKQRLRTLYLEILSVAGGLFLLYAFILLIVFIVFYLIRSKAGHRDQWLWPTPDLLNTYYRSILLSSIFCAASIAAILMASRGATVVIVSVIAFIGIAGYLLRMKRGWTFKALNIVAQNMRIDRSLDYRRAYVANVVMLVILIGVIPTIAFFRVALHAKTLLFIRDTEMKLAQQLKERQRQIFTRYSPLRPADDPGPLSNREAADALIQKRTKFQDDVYTKPFYGTTFEYEKLKQKLDVTNSQRDFLGPVLSFVVDHVPFYNQTSADLWGLAHNASDDNSWQWGEDAQNLNLHTPKRAEQGATVMRLTPDLNQVYASPNIFSLPTLLVIIGFAAMIMLLVLLARFMVTKLFLLDHEERSVAPVTTEKLIELKQNLFVVLGMSMNGTLATTRNGTAQWISLKAVATAAKLRKLEPLIINPIGPPTIVFENFEEGMNDPHLGSDALALIEKVLAQDRNVVIISGAEPFAYRWAQPKTNGEGAGIEERWAELAGRFTKAYFSESCCNDDFAEIILDRTKAIVSDPTLTKSQKKNALRSVEIVRAECSPRLVLRRIGKEILKPEQFLRMRAADVYRQIGSQAKMYYRRVWEALHDDEKLTLLHLAEDRLLSPSDPQIDQLFSKGLIVRTPEVRLLNDTFKEFVLGNCFTGDLAFAETEAKTMSPWEKLKLPLFIGMVTVVLFLALTQKQFFGSSLSIVGALISGLPTAFKLINFLQGQSSGQKVLNSAANQLAP